MMPSTMYHLTKIPYSAVQADMAATTESTPVNLRKFNTFFHPAAITAAAAPPPPPFSEEPYSFGRWTPLILSSRNLPPSALQIVSLTHSQATLLCDATTASLASGEARLNRLFREDIEEVIYPVFDKLNFFLGEEEGGGGEGGGGIWLRLAACSPKDTLAPRRKEALRSVEDLVLRLVTSQKVQRVMSLELEKQQKKSCRRGMDLFVLPFDKRMRSAKEYRVFVPPFSSFSKEGEQQRGPRITGISQYEWHKRWLFADEDDEEAVTRVAGDICRGAEQILTQIVEVLHRRRWVGGRSSEAGTRRGGGVGQDEGGKEESKGDDEEARLDLVMARQGFSFDLLYNDDTRRCELVELNGFGAQGSCGSCLFQWVDDRDVLHNGHGEEKGIELRVAV